MDRYEYKVRADEIRALIAAKQYREAVEIADTIDWRNVKNGMMLCTISDLYKICKRYTESRDILLLAYQRNPGGRMILYSLCELSIKLDDVVNAVEYYKEFVQVAPRDTGKYVLQYKLYEAQEVSLEERIAVLEELQSRECKEKWMYELAYLYHRVGLGTQCVEECNQIVIYFGEGKYVVKALELKRLHQPLTAEQDALYRQLTGVDDIEVKAMDVSQYSTIDLQKELANSLKEVLYDDTKQSMDKKPVIEPAYEDVSNQAALEDITDQSIQNEEFVADPDDMNQQRTQVIHTQQVEQELHTEKSENEHHLSEAVFAPENRIVDNHEIINSMNLGLPTEDLDSDKTQIYSKDSLERALQRAQGADEIQVQEKKNNNFDDMLSLEGDGQIRLVVPEQQMVEKQITGQISIEDVLNEWERMKRESEKKWREDVRKRVLEYTGGIFADFDASSKSGLLERLEVSVGSDDKVEDLESDNTSTDDIRRVDVPIGTVTENVGSVNILDENVHPNRSNEYSDITEITFDDDELNDAKEETAAEPTEEELSFDRMPFSSGEEPATDAEPPIFTDNTTVLPLKDNLDYFMKFAAASEEKDEQDREFEEQQTASLEEPFKDETVADESFDEEPIADETASVEMSNHEVTGQELTNEDFVSEGEQENQDIGNEELNEEQVIEEQLIEEPTDEELIDEEPVEESVEEVVENIPVKPIKKGWFASHFGKKTAPISVQESQIADSEESIVEDNKVSDESVDTDNEETLAIESEVNLLTENEGFEPISEEETSENSNLQSEEDISENLSLQSEEEIKENLDFQSEENANPRPNLQTMENSTENLEDKSGEVNKEEEDLTLTSDDDSESDYDEATDEDQETSKETSEEDTNKSEDSATGNISELSPEQEERFEIFIETESGREQIIEAIKNISMNSKAGNIIIGSDDKDGAVELSKAFILELQERDTAFNGKVAKVKARTLNAKDADSTLSQFNGGAIIIQDANELRRETLDGMRRVMQSNDMKLFVSMIASKRTKHKFIMENSDLLDNFTVSVDVESLDNAELVKYGKEYAYSREYAIDDMGILALHTRIDEMQTSSHMVNVVEVREIIEEAISHSSKKSVGHFFDVVVAKRYDKNDMIILKEKDFIHN